MRKTIRHSRPTIGRAEAGAIAGVLKSGYIGSGDSTEKFEKQFARSLHTGSAVAVNSGTAALHLALLALKIKPRDEVILPSYVCTAVLNAVVYTGATPILADINIHDFNIRLADVKSKISKNTKAIIVPHMFGKPAAIDNFRKLGIRIIENCAHSLGARYKGRNVGAWGDASIFSFYATKVIATGYGGMVCSRHKDTMRRIKDVVDVDERDNYVLRFNYRMSDIAAAVGIAQLGKLNSFIFQRREIAEFYNRNLVSEDITLPDNTEKDHIYFRYVVRIAGNIGKIIQRLSSDGIEAKRPVFKPLHHYLRLDKKRFPNTEAVFHSALSLPIYPHLTRAEAKLVIQSLKKAIK